MTPAGLPHSEILGSKLACSSPRRFAACCVLRRRRAPRHPPCAVVSCLPQKIGLGRPSEPSAPCRNGSLKGDAKRNLIRARIAPWRLLLSGVRVTDYCPLLNARSPSRYRCMSPCSRPCMSGAHDNSSLSSMTVTRASSGLAPSSRPPFGMPPCLTGRRSSL